MSEVIVDRCPDCGAPTGDIYYHREKECTHPFAVAQRTIGNPYLDRLAKAGKNPHGRKSEKRVAKKMGAKLHRGSGSSRGQKSDASRGSIRLEAKSTVTQTLALDMAWLVKIAQEALAAGQTPAVSLSFVDASGKSRLRQYAEWVAIPMSVFQELVEFD